MYKLILIMTCGSLMYGSRVATGALPALAVVRFFRRPGLQQVLPQYEELAKRCTKTQERLSRNLQQLKTQMTTRFRSAASQSTELIPAKIQGIKEQLHTANDADPIKTLILMFSLGFFLDIKSNDQNLTLSNAVLPEMAKMLVCAPIIHKITDVTQKKVLCLAIASVLLQHLQRQFNATATVDVDRVKEIIASFAQELTAAINTQGNNNGHATHQEVSPVGALSPEEQKQILADLESIENELKHIDTQSNDTHISQLIKHIPELIKHIPELVKTPLQQFFNNALSE